MLKRMMLIAVLAAALSACAADKAGLTRAEVDVGLYDNTAQTPYVSKVRFTDGKEKESVSVTVTFGKDGKPTISYTAGGVRAFEGQRARAEVHKALTEAGANVAPRVLDIILKTMSGL